MTIEEELNNFEGVIGISLYDSNSKLEAKQFEIGQKLLVLNPYFRFANDCNLTVKVMDEKNLILLRENESFKSLIEKELINYNS